MGSSNNKKCLIERHNGSLRRRSRANAFHLAGDQPDLEAGPRVDSATTTSNTNGSIPSCPSPSRPSNEAGTDVGIDDANEKKEVQRNNEEKKKRLQQVKDFVRHSPFQALFVCLYLVALSSPVAEVHLPWVGQITAASCLTVIHMMSFLMTTLSIIKLEGKVDELSTKVDVVDKKVDQVRTELSTKIDEATTEIGEVRTELSTKIETEIGEVRTELSTKIETEIGEVKIMLTQMKTNQRHPTAPAERADKAKKMMAKELISKKTKLYVDGADVADLQCANEIVMQMKDETSTIYVCLDSNFDENGNVRMNADDLWVAFMRMTAENIAQRRRGRSDP